MGQWNKFTTLKESDEAGAERVFRNELMKAYPRGLPLFHETTISAGKRIRMEGFSAEEGFFATIGRPSNFITSKEKAIVEVHIPTSRYSDVFPDMRYTDTNPARALLIEHNGVKGADVSFADAVPASWIKNVTFVK